LGEYVFEEGLLLLMGHFTSNEIYVKVGRIVITQMLISENGVDGEGLRGGGY
jgi:hypothetical protein